MRAFLVDVTDGTAREVETTGELSDYYAKLHCSIIDITSRCIGGRWYDIVADDEGLFVEGAKVSAIDSQGQPALVGSLLVLRYDETTGDNVGLTPEDIQHLQRHVCVATYEGGDVGTILRGVDYDA